MFPPQTLNILSTYSHYLNGDMIDLNECRNCGHIHYSKWNNGGSCSNCFLKKDEIILYANMYCNCKERIPMDNLEYLELLYDKKTSPNPH